MNWWTYIDHAGSIASISGFLLGCYILLREVRIGSEVHVLRAEEEKWHDVGKR